MIKKTIKDIVLAFLCLILDYVLTFFIAGLITSGILLLRKSGVRFTIYDTDVDIYSGILSLGIVFFLTMFISFKAYFKIACVMLYVSLIFISDLIINLFFVFPVVKIPFYYFYLTGISTYLLTRLYKLIVLNFNSKGNNENTGHKGS